MPEPATLSDALVEEVETSTAVMLVHLSKAPIADIKDGVLLSEITEADFVGYAPVVPMFEPCDVDDDDYGEIASQEVLFEVGLVETPQLIYFAYLTSQLEEDDAPSILGVYEFPEPVRACDEGQLISTGAWRITKIP